MPSILISDKSRGIFRPGPFKSLLLLFFLHFRDKRDEILEPFFCLFLQRAKEHAEGDPVSVLVYVPDAACQFIAFPGARELDAESGLPVYVHGLVEGVGIFEARGFHDAPAPRSEEHTTELKSQSN